MYKPKNTAEYALIAYIAGLQKDQTGFVRIDYAQLCAALHLQRQTTMMHIRSLCASGAYERRLALDSRGKQCTELRWSAL